jgi:large subunit ribosomal protein L9
MIEVILLERIERLGHMGQVVKVRPGFARNFLLPQKKALRATKSNLDLFEKQRVELEEHNVEARNKAEALAKKLEKVSLVIIRQASDAGHLYGSVTARDVADAGKEANQPIERSQVYIVTPIKSLGLYDVKVKLHPEVTIKLKINVARSVEEAAVQAEKGAAVIKAAAEKAEVVAAFGAPEEVAPAAEGEAKAAKKKKAKAADAEAEGEEAPKAKKPRAKKAAEV